MSVLNYDAQWRIDGHHRLLFRSWNDETDVVCYDTTSGDTHLLSPFVVSLLSLLQRDNALRLDAITSHVAASLDVESNETLVLAIEETLSEFTERGVLVQT